MGFEQLTISIEGAQLKILRASSVIPEYLSRKDVSGMTGQVIDFTTQTDPIEDTTSIRKGENYPHDKMFRIWIGLGNRRSYHTIADRSFYFDIQDVVSPSYPATEEGLADFLEFLNGWLTVFQPSDLADLKLDLRFQNPYMNGGVPLSDTDPIASVEDQSVVGGDFVQAASVAQAPFDATAKTGDTDGSADFWHSAAFLAAVGGDTAGTFFCVFDDDAGAGQFNTCMGFADNTSNTQYFRFGFSSADVPFIQSYIGSSNLITFTATSIVRGGRNYLFASSDGGGYGIRLNGNDESHVGGANNGNFMGDNVLLNTVYISALPRSTPLFFSHGFKYMGYISGRVATSEEMTNWQQWVIDNL